MKKTFQLNVQGKHRDRVLEAIKHEVRKYMRRERGKPLPAGVDFVDFDCRFGETPDQAQVAHVATLTQLMDAVAQSGGAQFYVELLSKPGIRIPRERNPDESIAPDSQAESIQAP
jgi:hypothetical protein